MGQEAERTRRLRDLARLRASTPRCSRSPRDGRDRPALPARARRRGDHRGRALRAAVGRLGPGREPPARAEGAARARRPGSRQRAAAPGQRPDPVLPGRHGRADRGQLRRLVLGARQPRRRHGTSSGTATTRARSHGPCVEPGSRCSHLPWYEGAFTVDVHARRAGCTSSGTCSSCGSSGTTSRTRSAASASCSGTSPPGSPRRRCRPFVTLHCGDAAGREHPEHRRERRDRGRARRLLPAAADRARADARSSSSSRRDPGGALPRLLVRVPALVEGGFAIKHPEAGGGVAFFAHVGGFVFGVLDRPPRPPSRPPLRPPY